MRISRSCFGACLQFSFAIACVVFSSRCAIAEQTPESQVVRPNIIFVLVDDMGYGDFGVFYQNQRLLLNDRNRPAHRTPSIDQLANEGMRLPHHYCPAPVCAPSRASLLLGVHQGHANVRDNQFDKALEDNHNLATMLKQMGYKTAAIGKYGLQGGQEQEEGESPDWPAHPNRRGFDEYYGYMRHRDGHEHYPREGIHRGRKQVWENMTEVSAGLDKCYTTDLFTARAKYFITEQVREAAEQPFFIYLAYDTPHAVLSLPTQAYPAGAGVKGGLQWLGTPGEMINTASGAADSYYHPDCADATWDHDADPSTPEVAWPDVQKRYATCVRRIDDGVGDILQLLKDLGIDNDTLIVFTTDNGPSVESYLPEAYEPIFFQSYGPYDGIKRDLLEAGVHVGAVVRWPALIPAGSSSGNWATTFWDWMPTFAEAAGGMPPARTDGVSLLPLLSGNVAEQRSSTVYSEYFQQGKTPAFKDFDVSNRGRRRRQMQLIREGDLVGVRYDVKSHQQPFEIYNIVEDMRQSKDLAAELPEIQAAMQARVLRLRRANASAQRPYDNELIPALDGLETLPGLNWLAVAGDFAWVPELQGQTSQWSGVAELPSESVQGASEQGASEAVSATHTASMFSGFIEVPQDGLYAFSLSTSGRALVRLHEAILLDADANYQAGQQWQSKMRLAKGKHAIRIYRLDEQPAGDFKFGWSGPGVAEGAVPATAFSRQVP
ncbi:sulfatase-like hydrolase/transferase [Planctomycetaceae bacterium SH139]